MDHLLTSEEISGINFSPIENPDVISIIKQPDGNYRGFMNKNEQLVQVRAGDPNTVLNLLLTHSGN